jgi:hypothetical protein
MYATGQRSTSVRPGPGRGVSRWEDVGRAHSQPPVSDVAPATTEPVRCVRLPVTHGPVRDPERRGRSDDVAPANEVPRDRRAGGTSSTCRRGGIHCRPMGTTRPIPDPDPDSPGRLLGWIRLDDSGYSWAPAPPPSRSTGHPIALTSPPAAAFWMSGTPLTPDRAPTAHIPGMATLSSQGRLQPCAYVPCRPSDTHRPGAPGGQQPEALPFQGSTVVGTS